jgi:hypothetical protein
MNNRAKANKNNGNPGRNVTRRTRRRRQPRNRELGLVTIPRSLTVASPFPNEMITTLTANLAFAMQGAALFVVNDYRINSLYQFDVTGGTTNNFSGATQLGTIYDSYHIMSIAIQVDLSGNESAQPVYFGLVFKDAQPSVVIVSQATAINSLEVTPTTGRMSVGQASGQQMYRSREYTIPVGSIIGNPLSYNADVDYTSSFGNFNPTQSVWMGAVAYGVGGNITGGVIVNMCVKLKLRAFSLKPLLA